MLVPPPSSPKVIPASIPFTTPGNLSHSIKQAVGCYHSTPCDTRYGLRDGLRSNPPKIQSLIKQLHVINNFTTTDSIPNDADGQDTLSSNGKWTSTTQDGTGMNYTFSDQGEKISPAPTESLNDTPIPKNDDSLMGTSESKNDDSKNALLGNDWNSPSNTNADGAATSSITPDDSASDKWP